MKTCKNFCDRYVEKIKKEHALTIEKTKKKLESITPFYISNADFYIGYFI